MGDQDHGGTYWILADDSGTKAYTLESQSSTDLILFGSFELAQSAAVQCEAITGKKLVPVEVSVSIDSFIDFLRRLSHDDGVNAITLVRDGEPSRTVPIADFIALAASQRR